MLNDFGPALASVANSTASSASSIVGATPYFVAITAAVGGVTGLGIGIHDAIKNIKLYQAVKAKKLILAAQSYQNGTYGALSDFESNLSSKVKSKFAGTEDFANWINSNNENLKFCSGSRPMPYRKIIKMEKNRVGGSSLASTENMSDQSIESSFASLQKIADKIKAEADAKGLSEEQRNQIVLMVKPE